MARTPRRVQPDDDNLSPLDETMFVDAQGIAGDFAEVLDALAGFDAGAIKGFLYRKPSNGIGKFEIIEETHPPFDMAAIVGDLKERFGGGSFQLRLMAGGRVRKNVDFDIVREKTPQAPPKSDNMDFLHLMLAQQSESRRESQAAADRQMQMMQAQQAQTMQMFMSMSQQSTAMITAMMGGREKISEFLPLLMHKNGDGGMVEALTVLEKAKGLFGGDGKGGGDGYDPEAGMVENITRLAGPVLGALGRAVQPRQEVQGQVAYVAPASPPAPLQLSAPLALDAPQEEPRRSRFAVLDLVRDDVLLCFSKGRSPRFTADMVAALIDESGVEQGEIDALAQTFAASANPLDDLAAEGIDLRSNPVWAAGFYAELQSVFAEPGDEDDGSQPGGDQRGEGDPAQDGGAREVGHADGAGS